MAKGNALKFLEGALVGVALGVAASMFLESKKGKKMKEDVIGVMADFYKYISPKIRKIEKMGENQYKEFMKKSVEQYAKAKKISQDMTSRLMEGAQQSWQHFSEQLKG